MKKLFTPALLLLATLGISACTSTHAPELVGEPREPIKRAQVLLEKEPPEGAELIANLSTTYAMAIRSDEDQKLEDAIERLRAQAAQFGANVLVITKVENVRMSGQSIGGLYEGQTATAVEASPYKEVNAAAYYRSSRGTGRPK
ncbi:hypothetical protein IDSA_01240 [Pseudidiomarina salinarum]|uniref:Lipoprotein n=1 Tax=Pseudidiomarina salinarum TaxID=435908 RepID=A0A094J006_9GAMM|nr:hypothetical protein [Pseudidiomarina salinarum]KFZ31374.1 hypothetical protein IDSA_01240 [Pseudidiomarina salinarum]RUO70864.1 hypothetical protein CWI79_05330 [Pseudidiomarina salinarum]